VLSDILNVIEQITVKNKIIGIQLNSSIKPVQTKLNTFILSPGIIKTIGIKSIKTAHMAA
jgi:hypothetical protein